MFSVLPSHMIDVRRRRALGMLQRRVVKGLWGQLSRSSSVGRVVKESCVDAESDVG